MKKLLFITLVALVALAGCKKDDPKPKNVCKFTFKSKTTAIDRAGISPSGECPFPNEGDIQIKLLSEGGYIDIYLWDDVINVKTYTIANSGAAGTAGHMSNLATSDTDLLKEDDSGLYRFPSGTVTVKKFTNEHIHVVVNAMTDSDEAIKIEYNGAYDINGTDI